MTSLLEPAPIEQVARQFARTVGAFDQHAEVFRVISERLLARLDLLLLKPLVVLDLGCRSGYQLKLLQSRYPAARIIGVDPAPAEPHPTAAAGRLRGWLRLRSRSPQLLAADPHNLPLAEASVDLVISNMLLPWCHAPQRVFAEVARVLRPGGAFLFSSAGPDTLREYRAAWAAVDSCSHGFGLIDMHDLGDGMLAAGLTAPVLDRQNLTIYYASIDMLEQELRHLGAANIAQGRRRGLMSPHAQHTLRSGTDVSVRFQVTLEMVQGHAWKGELARSRGANPDVHSVSLESLRQSLKQ